MVNSYVTFNANGLLENGHKLTRQLSSQQVFLPWLDVRVFYVRVSKCEIDDSTPEYLTVNHTPLHPDTLLEVNGIRTSINSDGPSTLLRRDRLDKKSEEATFVSTDSIRVTGSVNFEVFDKDVLVLSGVLELCNSNGYTGGLRNCGQKWSMNCESDLTLGTSFLKVKQHMSPESTSPTVEVYVAGSFSGNPTILTKTLQFNLRKKQMRKGMLHSIPEYEDAGSKDYDPSPTSLQLSGYNYINHKPEMEDYSHLYSGREYLEGEDGELSWFNAGVRVGVGIGLSVCLGVGIGVGLLVQAYQGTTRNFRRRL